MLKNEYNLELIEKDANNLFSIDVPVIPRQFVAIVPEIPHILWLSSPFDDSFAQISCHRPCLEV